MGRGSGVLSTELAGRAKGGRGGTWGCFQMGAFGGLSGVGMRLERLDGIEGGSLRSVDGAVQRRLCCLSRHALFCLIWSDLD